MILWIFFSFFEGLVIWSFYYYYVYSQNYNKVGYHLEDGCVSVKISKGTACLVKCIVVAEVHIEPIIKGQSVGVFDSTLWYLVIPQRREIKHFFFFDCHVVRLSSFERWKPLLIFIKIGVDTDPFIGLSSWNTIKDRFLSFLVVPFGHFVRLLL